MHISVINVSNVPASNLDSNQENGLFTSYPSNVNNEDENKHRESIQKKSEIDNRILLNVVNLSLQSSNDLKQVTHTLYPYLTSNKPNNSTDSEPTSNAVFEKKACTIFIRNVFLILVLLLCVTIGMVTLVLNHMPTLYFIKKVPFLLYFMIFFVCQSKLCILLINAKLRHREPFNYICLIYFSTIVSLTIAVATANFYSLMVLYFFGVLTWVFFCMILSTFQFYWSFSFWGGTIYMGLITFSTFSFLSILFPCCFVNMFLISILVYIFAVFFFYKVLGMTNGSYLYSILPKEYVIAALYLYLDLFLPIPINQ